VFALLLCNDAAVLGPWVNQTWLNVIAVFIVGVLLALSTILVVTTVFTTIDVVRLALVLGVFVVAGTIAVGVFSLRGRPPAEAYTKMSREERQGWRMPALALLERPPWSPVRRVAIVALSAYLVLAIVMLAVKAVELAVAR
jgi:hypothetical protein